MILEGWKYEKHRRGEWESLQYILRNTNLLDKPVLDTACIFNIAKSTQNSNIFSSFQVKQLELVASSFIYIYQLTKWVRPIQINNQFVNLFMFH